jgi:hypothetical protein
VYGEYITTISPDSFATNRDTSATFQFVNSIPCVRHGLGDLIFGDVRRGGGREEEKWRR